MYYNIENDENLPKRTDEIYQEIEAFEDYEFTNCIAFEMCIRNKEVKELLSETLLFSEVKEIPKEKIEGIEVLKSFMIPIDDIDSKHNTYKELCKFGIVGSSAMEYTIRKGICKDKLVSCVATAPEYTKIIDTLNDLEYKEVCNLEKGLHNTLEFEELETKKKILSTKMTEGEKVTLEVDILENNQDYINRYGGSLETIMLPKSKNIIKNALIQKQEINILNLFSRPILELPYSTKSNIQLNINLPKDELIAYITKIKDDYDNDNTIIKTPLEVLGEEFEKSDNKHTQKKPKPQKWADWFFIYDCYKILKANRTDSNETLYGEIDLLLLEHYNSDKENYYSIETYKKTIIKNMTYLINDLGYKELITGIANDNLNI